MLLPYHLRLAVRSLRRDPGLSATIVIVLAIAAVDVGAIAAGLVLFWSATIAATLVPALSAARVPPSVASRSL